MPKIKTRVKPENYHVVVVGGGFCGLHVAKILEKKLPKGMTIALFDKKPYFEYVPAVHKLIFDPDYHEKITIPYSQLLKRTRLFVEPVTNITGKRVQTENRTVEFNYLVLCPGIGYPIFLKNKKNTFTITTCKGTRGVNSVLRKAHDIVIVGGGLIGMEVAGELVTKTNKHVIIVHPGDRTLNRNPPAASHYAERFVEKRGATIIFGEKVTEQRDGVLVTDKGRMLKADLILWCAGIASNVKWLSPQFKDSLNERKFIIVNEHLQMKDHPNVFVGGDLNTVPEEKTAQNAERQAHVIAANILALIDDKPLPKVHKPRTGPLVISLGDRHGIFSYKNISFHGILPGILKWLIQYYVMWRTRRLAV